MNLLVGHHVWMASINSQPWAKTRRGGRVDVVKALWHET